MNVLYVALGGGVGAAMRYLLGLIPYRGNFPLWTLMTNFLGSVIIGFIMGINLTEEGMPKKMDLFLKTGLCGGFTTFSTFSMETIALIEDGKYILAASYMFMSLFLCLLGVILGRYIHSKLNIYL